MKCFHHTDMDGWCSAAIVAMKENTEIMSNFIEIDYDNKSWDKKVNIINNLEKDETVYIVDLSFNENTINFLKLICEKVGTENVHWIDHHKTSIEAIKKFPEIKNHIKGILSDEHSGAYLTYQYLFPENNIIPYAVRLVSDFDAYHLKMYPSSMEFMYYINSKPEYAFKDTSDYKTVVLWKNLINYNNSCYEIINAGKHIMDYVYTDFNRYKHKFCYESKINIPNMTSEKCAVINRQYTGSMIFGELQQKYKYLVSFAFDGNKYNYSIYSEFKDDPNIDCSLVAKYYGGGGHKGAAGFISDKLLFKKTGDIKFERNV